MATDIRKPLFQSNQQGIWWVNTLGISLLAVGLIIIIVMLGFQKFHKGWFVIPFLIVSGGIVLIVLKRPKGAPIAQKTYKCDQTQGCIETDNGISQTDCISECVQYQRYIYDKSQNSCIPQITYGSPKSPYTDPTTCEQSTASYDCSGNECTLAPSYDSPGSTSYSTCKTNCKTYSCNDEYECTPDPNGTSYSDCTSKCKRPPPSQLTFSCDLKNYKCTVDPKGTSFDECKKNCVSPRFNCTQNQCVTNAQGTFRTQESCERSCSPPASQRYNCNSSYNCVANDQGTFPSLSACQSNCAAPPAQKYKCKKGVCSEDPKGKYPTMADCQQNCSTSNQKYNCTQNQCVANAQGTFPSLSACQSSCPPPTSQKYNCTQNQCVENAQGTFPSLSACQSNCPPPTSQKYRCKKGVCSADAKGTFPTLADCQQNCTSSQMYRCRKGTCSIDRKGTFPTLSACQAQCTS